MGIESEKTEPVKGLIFNIQRYSIHDGPGIRTLVFMKGCPLSCQWCSNPEGISHHTELVYKKANCIGCGACGQICPQDAIYARSCPRGSAKCLGCGFCKPLPTEGDAYLIDRRRCNSCGKCAKVCPTDAKSICGEWKTTDEIVEMAKRDQPFYKGSMGGITMGGGEVLTQPEFVREVLSRCHEIGINTAIETCGYGDWNALDRIADHCDTIHYDIKAVDTEKHKTLTGKGFGEILDNLTRLSKKLSLMGKKRPALVIRLPLVEGVNDTPQDITAVGKCLGQLPCFDHVEILPFHNLGEQKYIQLGREYKFSGKANAAPGAFDLQARQLSDQGFSVKVSTW